MRLPLRLCLALALPALLLAACGAPRTARPAPEPERPEIAECRREARDSGAMRDLGRQLNPSNPANMDRLRAEAAEAERRAFNDCLRRRGVLRGGGVEPVRRPGMF